MGRLDQRVAFITGAARGQGSAHAVRLAEDGADIVAIDLVDQANTVELVEARGQRIIARRADVRDQGSLDAVVAEAMETFGRLDIVVANAGIRLSGLSWEMTESQWQDAIGINLTGVWHTIKACLPAIISGARGGAIVLISSLAGLQGYGNISGYVSAKHGVNGLMRSLAVEVAPHMIRVNTVCPGLVGTDMMLNEAIYRTLRPDVENPTLEDAKKIFRSMQLLPIDWLEPRDISNAVAWLVSDEARYVTGTAIPVDGGQLQLNSSSLIE